MDPTINHLNQLVNRVESLTEELQIANEIINALFEEKEKDDEKISDKKLEKAAHGKGKKAKNARLAMKLRERAEKKKKELKEAADLAAEHEYLSGMLQQQGIEPQKAEAIKARLKQIQAQLAPGNPGAAGGQYYTNTVAGEY